MKNKEYKLFFKLRMPNSFSITMFSFLFTAVFIQNYFHCLFFGELFSMKVATKIFIDIQYQGGIS